MVSKQFDTHLINLKPHHNMTQTCHSCILLLVAMVCRVGGGGGVSVDSECHTCHHSPPTSQHTFTRHSGSYFYIVTNIENTYILSLEK